MHHKTILDYAKHSHKNDAIDICRYNHNNMVGEDFTDTIKRDLPILHNVLNPISKMHLIHKLQDLTMNTQIQGWEEFGKNRRKELRNLEKTIVFNQNHQEQFFTHMETNLQGYK